MRAIILAAGIGRRLAEVSDGRPKCLLEISGISLLQRHLAALKRYAIDDIFIVSGYQSAMITAALNALSSNARILFNPDYLEGSIVSLWTARAALLDAEEVLLMDADVLYDDSLLARLLNSSHRNCLLLDRVFEEGDEPVKVCVKNGSIIGFSKQIDADLDFDLIGESVGFFKLSHAAVTKLLAGVQRYIDDNRRMTPYEEAIRDLAWQGPGYLGYEDITGIQWIEIDFPADVETANKIILPAISR